MQKLLMILVVLAFTLSACTLGADVDSNNNINNNNNNNANNTNNNNADNEEDMDEPWEDTEEVMVEPTEETTEEPTEPPTELPPPEPVPFELTSPAFAHGAPIPVKFSCDGEDVSPELVWGDPPEGTQSFVLVFDDPDAGGWVHWLLYNIPADARGLAEGTPTDATLQDGSMNGKNSWNALGYGGPCPPGGTHRYVFTLYALDTVLDVEPGLKKNQVLPLLSGHILGQITLMGTFSR